MHAKDPGTWARSSQRIVQNPITIRCRLRSFLLLPHPAYHSASMQIYIADFLRHALDYTHNLECECLDDEISNLQYRV